MSELEDFLNDLSLETKVEKEHDLNDSEVDDLNNLLQINDEILKKWYFQKNYKKLLPINKVSLMFKKFKF